MLIDEDAVRSPPMRRDHFTSESAGPIRLCGVVVTHRPEAGALAALFRAVGPQLDGLVVVDNGSGAEVAALVPPGAEFMPLGGNLGLAAAQNRGIKRAAELGATHVLLLDQDSVPAPGMAAALLHAAQQLAAEGKRVAAVGPAYEDARRGATPPFAYLDGIRIRRRDAPAGQETVEADFLIASGSLVPMAALDAVGPMTEELFIDYVDIEWGLRARRFGYRCYGAPAARMAHSLGDGWIGAFGRRIPAHSPLRHYYHVRNAVWLCRRPWLPMRWRAALALRIVQQCVFFSLFVPQRLGHARMMGLGLWHGLRNRMGPR